MPWSCSWKRCSTAPDASSHTHTSLSNPRSPVASRRAVGDSASADSAPTWPRRNTCVCGSITSPTTAQEPTADTKRTEAGPREPAGAATSPAVAGEKPDTAACDCGARGKRAVRRAAAGVCVPSGGGVVRVG